VAFANLKKSKGDKKMKRKRKGFTLVELLVVIAIIALLMGILMPALARVRQIAFRMVCGSNLSGIGRAMLIYANDYENNFPRAGYSQTVWSNRVLNWAAGNRAAAFGNPGEATVSASLYSLVKYAEVTPKSFVCKGDTTRKAFKASDYLANKEDEDVWDFGGVPNNSATDHCSYSYHTPYNRFFLSLASSEPGMAVAADRNPHLDWTVNTSNFNCDIHDKDLATGVKISQLGNAASHQREGQNVLFMDNHVYFEKFSFCGVDEDNIYTLWNPSVSIRQGQPPVCDTYTFTPQDKKDSLLVNECGPDPGSTPIIQPPPLQQRR
jgi:prepilin-type N-terminal cleavage/methylation domain-containing protein